MSDQPVTLKWSVVTVTEFPRTNTYRPGSMRVLRSATAPPCTVAEGTRPQRFYGEPTRIFVFQGEASVGSWSVDPGFCTVPRELAEYLIRGGRARLAHPDERPARTSDDPPYARQ